MTERSTALILIECPFVVTAAGTRLAGPVDVLREIL